MVAVEMQLGKQGITENFIQHIEEHFKKHHQVRVAVLKSAGHEKEKVREYSKEILKRLGENYTARIIGFKIILKKWRRAR